MSTRQPPDPGPGRVLVIGTDSGWRQWQPALISRGFAGELILPYPQDLAGSEPCDLGVYNDVRVWSIRDPRESALKGGI